MCLSFDTLRFTVQGAKKKWKDWWSIETPNHKVGYLPRSSPDRCHLALAMPSFAQEAMIGKVQNVCHHHLFLDGKNTNQILLEHHHHHHHYLLRSILDPARVINNDWSAAKNRSRIDMWNSDAWGNSSAALAPLQEARVLWYYTILYILKLLIDSYTMLHYIINTLLIHDE